MASPAVGSAEQSIPGPGWQECGRLSPQPALRIVMSPAEAGPEFSTQHKPELVFRQSLYNNILLPLSWGRKRGRDTFSRPTYSVQNLRGF